MKIKILIVVITCAVLAGLSLAGFYIYKNFNRPINVTELPSIPLSINDGKAKIDEDSAEQPDEGEVLKETRILKENFEIILPPGWQEATTPPEGVLFMAIDAEQDISGGLFQKLDFRTNLAIKSDNITKYADISSFEDYVASIKISLIQAISGINCTQDEQKTINGAQAVSIECSSRQEEADFKTLLVFVKGNNNAIYAISFNTFQDSWLMYKDLFYRMAESFKL
ncbi:MAG: hypothetical protein ABH841_03245, partial [Candidatus Nealsonbacteria bacterium]